MKAICLLCLMLTGCATVFDGPQPTRDEITARIQIVDDAEMPEGRAGDAACANGRCLIRIRRSTYPLCITHEVIHGFSPRFHEGRESDAYCYATR